MHGHVVRAMTDPDRLSRRPTWLLREATAEGRGAPVRHSGVNDSHMSTRHESVFVFESPPPHLCFSPAAPSPLPFLARLRCVAFAPSAQPSNCHMRRTRTSHLFAVVQSFAACFLPLLLAVASLHSSVAVPSACARWSLPLSLSLSLPCRSNGKGQGTRAERQGHTRKKNTGTNMAVLSFFGAHCPLPSLGCPLPPPPLPLLARSFVSSPFVVSARAHTDTTDTKGIERRIATRRACVLQFRARAGWLVSRGRPGRKLLHAAAAAAAGTAEHSGSVERSCRCRRHGLVLSSIYVAMW
jgi:hypothetical protein